MVHPYFEKILSNYFPVIPANKQDEDKENVYEYCPVCNGSGEGQHESINCTRCHGRGCVK